MKRSLLIAIALTAWLLPGLAFAKLSAACKATPYFRRHREIQRVFLDQLRVAGATARIALSQRVADMQGTRRRLEDLAPPKCAALYHAIILDAADGEIETLLHFMAEDKVSAQMAQLRAQEKWEIAGEILNGPRPPPPPEPTPAPVTCCICGELAASGQEIVDMPCGRAHWACPKDDPRKRNERNLCAECGESLLDPREIVLDGRGFRVHSMCPTEVEPGKCCLCGKDFRKKDAVAMAECGRAHWRCP